MPDNLQDLIKIGWWVVVALMALLTCLYVLGLITGRIRPPMSRRDDDRRPPSPLDDGDDGLGSP
jgi:hypothetical protein